MKILSSSKFIFVILFLAASCKKEVGIPVRSLSSVTVVNAISGSNPLISDFLNTKSISAYYLSTPQIAFDAAQEYSVASGSVPAVIYQITDTTHAVYRNDISVQKAGIYSLFLCGTAAQPENIFITDHPPFHPAADSTVGVRFINLSLAKTSVSVDIQGKSNGSEVQSLDYKSVTNFKNYPATYNISSYTFEFKDASGNLLASYTLSGINSGDNGDQSTNQYRWNNITIVLAGAPGAETAFQENNY